MAAGAPGGITEIGPFVGEYGENFNQFQGGTGGSQSLELFGGHATLSNQTPEGAIKTEFSSQLGGDLVRPRSAPVMGGQLGIGHWDFATPAIEFGGYFENNSGADDATVNFYDTGLNLIGTKVAHVPAAGGAWVWNGWRSTTPIARIEVIGNGLINGFIWYDDMQLTLVPAPAGGAAIAGAFGALASRRRRGR